VAKGTVSGLFWGTLTGLLFMFPLAPMAGVAGGIMGAALGAAWRLGLKDDFKQRVQDLVQPGTSALMVIVRKIHPGQVHRGAAPLRRHGAQDVAWPRDAEQELMKDLTWGRRGPDPAPQRPSQPVRPSHLEHLDCTG